MELKQLQYFLAVAECGSFTRASLQLSVAQPMLSRHIKMLEKELGVELYQRTAHGIELNDAGKKLEQYARGILDTVGQVKASLADLGHRPTGRVTIGMSPSVQVVVAQPLVERFTRAYPEVSLSIMEGFSGHLQEWLSAGQLDVAILYRTPYNSVLNADALLTDELFLLGPANDPAHVGDGPISLKNLAHVPLVLPNRQHGLRILVSESFVRAGISPNIVLEMDAMPTTLRLVEHQVGLYTILSYSCAAEMIAKRQIRYWRIVEPSITRTLVITSSTRKPPSSASRALLVFVRKLVEDLARQGVWFAPV